MFNTRNNSLKNNDSQQKTPTPQQNLQIGSPKQNGKILMNQMLP